MNVNNMSFSGLMDEMPSSPKDIKSWILKEVVEKTYIIYSRYENNAVCTRCGHVFGKKFSIEKELRSEVSHNEKVICPHCKNQAILKAEGRGRKNLTEETSIFLFVKKGKDLYASLSNIDICFDSGYIPEVYLRLRAMYKFSASGNQYFTNGAWNYADWGWERREKIKMPQTDFTSMNGYLSKRCGIYLYNKNFKTVFANTCLQYADISRLLYEKKLSVYGIPRYCDLHVKHQSIELLRKAGFWNLVEDKIHERNGSAAIRWKNATMATITGLDRDQLRQVRENKFSLHELLIYKNALKSGYHLTKEQVGIVTNCWNLKDLKVYTKIPAARAAIYLSKQTGMTLGDYIDYLKECTELGYNTEEKKTLFPKDLKASHAKTSKLWQAEREKILAEKAAKETAEKLIKFREGLDLIYPRKEAFIKNGLLIRRAESESELRAEGQSLGHCVGSYGYKTASKISVILFIRRASAPEKSYYTMEFSAKREVLQCRGNGNCNMTDEVKDFIEIWKKEIVGNLIKQKKRQKAA